MIDPILASVFARAFKSGLQPVEIGRRLVKELDANRGLDVRGRAIAPNRFVVSLSAEDATQLANEASEVAEDLISVHQFTSLLHKFLSEEEKSEVVALLWRIAYADGRLDKYEDSLVLKVSDLLYVSRGRVMQLKHDAQAVANAPGASRSSMSCRRPGSARAESAGSGRSVATRTDAPSKAGNAVCKRMLRFAMPIRTCTISGRRSAK